MTLLFVSAADDPEEWAGALAALRPDIPFRVWPDVGDPAAVRYALAWRPPADALPGLPNLQAIFSLGAGIDGLADVPEALPPGVPVVRMVEEGLSAGMAEYVAWQVLDWHRGGALYRAQQQAGEWRRRRSKLAGERRIGILGLGVLGQSAARMLTGLGFPVAGWSRTAKTVDQVVCHHGADGLADLVAGSDILVNLLPLTPQTEGLINADLIAALPKGAVLINAARGRHVVDVDLLAALDSGHLAGAALDVFSTEPLPPDHPFWRHPRIALTPHVAALTLARTAAPAVVAQIARIERGEAPLHVVDAGRGY
ncbi:MAG: glyoxylate/hydroxypyruvate reductase A [Rhodospirillaceae bacterium]|nr:glyoxylate/hydroxypyruvate reductase A [Rhodospirillaceae bacterium]